MKNTILFILLSFSFPIYSQDEKNCETGTLSTLAEKISSPCSKGKKNDKLRDILSNLDDETSIESFCEDCKEPATHSEKKSKISSFNLENKKQFTKAMLNELRKNLSSTMIDLMSLRSTFSLNFKPEESISACNINDLALSKCKDGKSLQDLLQETIGSEDSFQNIQKDLSYEIANTLTLYPDEKQGLLKRKSSSCGISDNEFIHAKIKYQESLFTPALIASLKKSNIDFEKNVLSQLAGSNLSKADLDTVKKMSEHPMIQAMLKDGNQMTSFLKSFKGDITQEKIIENLFSRKNSEMLSKNLSSRCEKSFETIKETLCSSEFKTGNVIFNDFDSMNINIGPSLLKEDKEDHLYSFCMGIKTNTNKPLLFTILNKSLTKDMPTKRSKMDYKSLSSTYYDEDFYTPKEQICKSLEGQDCTSSQSMNCSISKFLKASRVPNSPQSKLLASHDPNIDRILGSLIGSAPTVDTKTRTFLTEQGILPKADGTIVEAKDTQIRNPSTYSSSVKSFEEKTGPTPQPNTPTQINKTAKTDSPESWKGADVNNSDNNDDSNAETSGSPKKKNKKSNFESLSGDLDNNDEFKDKFTDRMNNLKNKKSISKNKSANDEQDEENDYVFGEKKSNSNTVLNGSSNIQSGPGTVTTPIATPTQITSGAKGGHVATIDNTRVEQSSLNKAIIQAQNRSPATSDNVANTKISLTKTDAGLNNIEIKVPDESVLSESTPALEKKIQTYLDDSDNSLQGAKTGEAYFVKLGNYEIKVAINDHGVYIAKCTKKCPNLSTEYLSFLSKYFTGIKTSGMSRVSLANIINKERDKNVRNNSENKKSLE
jgi:hypothetical protein